jgi:hypothetical protein
LRKKSQAAFFETRPVFYAIASFTRSAANGIFFQTSTRSLTAEFCDVYEIESDFAKKVEAQFSKMIT